MYTCIQDQSGTCIYMHAWAYAHVCVGIKENGSEIDYTVLSGSRNYSIPPSYTQPAPHVHINTPAPKWAKTCITTAHRVYMRVQCQCTCMYKVQVYSIYIQYMCMHIIHYVHVHLYIHVRIYMYIHVHVHVHVYVYIHMDACTLYIRTYT